MTFDIFKEFVQILSLDFNMSKHYLFLSFSIQQLITFRVCLFGVKKRGSKGEMKTPTYIVWLTRGRTIFFPHDN